MNTYEGSKKCKYCKKNINITLYKSHKKKCMSQMIINPENHLLMNHFQLIQQYIEKYNQIYLNYLQNSSHC